MTSLKCWINRRDHPHKIVTRMFQAITTIRNAAKIFGSWWRHSIIPKCGQWKVSREFIHLFVKWSCGERERENFGLIMSFGERNWDSVRSHSSLHDLVRLVTAQLTSVVVCLQKKEKRNRSDCLSISSGQSLIMFKIIECKRASTKYSPVRLFPCIYTYYLLESNTKLRSITIRVKKIVCLGRYSSKFFTNRRRLSPFEVIRTACTRKCDENRPIDCRLSLLRSMKPCGFPQIIFSNNRKWHAISSIFFFWFFLFIFSFLIPLYS